MNHRYQDPLELMRAGVEYRFPIRLRSWEGKFRPLSNLELTQIATETAEQLRRQPELANSRMAESVLYAIKMLSLATSEPGGRDPQLTEATLQELSPDELQFLNREYQAVIERVNPCLETLSPDDVENWITDLKKKQIRPADLSFVSLANVCARLLDLTSPPGS